MTPRTVAGRNALAWLLLSAAVIVLDQVTKHLVVANFVLHESIELLPVLDLVRAHNEGAAWSFLAQAGGWQRWMFTGLAVVVSGALVVWMARLDRRAQALLAAGLSLIVGGALGNAIDRVRFGYVVDFVSVHWEAHYFPAFNVADSCIFIGACLVLIDSWLEARAARAATGGEDA